jgi:hypothetical protein
LPKKEEQECSISISISISSISTRINHDPPIEQTGQSPEAQ